MKINHAVVTGAASGMGALEVSKLIGRGVRVTALDLNPDVISAYADQPLVHAEQGDVSDLAWCRAVIKAAEERAPIDMLYHAAGIMPGGAVADMGAERIVSVMTVNYQGTVNMVDAVLPSFRQRGRGQIVLFGSVAGVVPQRKFAAYGASKAAINFYAEVLTRELAPEGIKVLLVTPNAVRTPLLQQAADGPKAITSMGPLLSKVAIAEPDKIVDQVDRAIRRGRRLTRPRARGFTAMRRLSTRLTWTVTETFDKVV